MICQIQNSPGSAQELYMATLPIAHFNGPSDVCALARQQLLLENNLQISIHLLKVVLNKNLKLSP